MQLDWKSIKVSAVTLAGIILLIYFFIALLPIPRGLVTGLDSWKYALSHFAAENWLYGDDIIFTYGPLGYLLRGSVINETFIPIIFFRYSLYLILFGIGIIRIVKIKDFLPKISFFLSLLFPGLISDEYETLQTEYQCLYIFVILLSWDNFLKQQVIRWYAFGLGAFAGFLTLTKLSLGVYGLSALTLFLLINLYTSVRAKEDLNIRVFALIDSWLAATSVAFLFLDIHPDAIFKNTLILISIIAIAYICSVAITPIYQTLASQFTPKREPSNFQLTISIKQWQFINWICFYLIYSVGLSITIYVSSPSLIAYTQGSWEILSGYSSAMSIVGSVWELGFAISEIVSILVILFFVARQGNLSFAATLTLILALNFKHGFVRQGGHVIRFFFSIPLLMALCILKIRKNWLQTTAYIIHAYVLFLAFFHYHLYASNKHPNNLLTGNFIRPLTPALVTTKASFLLNPGQLKAELLKTNQSTLEGVKLPVNVLGLLKDKKIDIVPWEDELVAANHLNWQPRPVFQSQAAYTVFLDNLNQQNLLKTTRDYILYNFLSIDGRHPFFNEPNTFFYILCNYKLSSEISKLVNLPSLTNLMILERRQSSICSPDIAGKKFSVNWNEIHYLETKNDLDLLMRAAIKFEYSLFGKIYKAFFRIPPVMVRFTYADGTTQDYRILPGNSENGVLINYLPKNDVEALSFFQRKLLNPVKSFSFYTSNPPLFSPKIKINLMSSKLLNFS